MRKPMVTRTIISTKATVLCLNVETAEPCNKEFVLPRTYKDEKKILKAIEAMNDDENLKAVHVVKVETLEELYGMTEEEFIKNAEILPPRTATK